MINLKNRLSGHFILHKAKGDGRGGIVPGTREKVAEFDNLILNQGLDYLGTGRPDVAINYVHVGTGTSTPTAAQTGLDSWVAYTSQSVSTNDGSQVAVSPYYIYRVQTKRFNQGVATGNISEVGVGWSSTVSDLFSRALILDGSSNPTTITVLADEILDVTYELRIHVPEGDFTGTIELGGITYDYTARACNCGQLSVGNLSKVTWSMQLAGNARPNANGTIKVYDGAAGDIFNLPAGNSDYLGDNPTSNAYSAGSYQAGITMSFGLTRGNLAGGIRTLAYMVGWTGWQVEFSAQGSGDPIYKTSDQVLSFVVSHSWARV